MFITSILFISCKMDKILISTIGKHYHKKWFFKGETGNEDTTVPFEFINGWIVVTVKLDGQDKEYKFVFDTGAITKVAPDVMRELNLAPLRDFSTTDLNGVKHPASLINIKKLQIGQRTFTKVGALSSETKLFKCYGIDGIIGYNLLDGGVFRLNFAKNIMTISRKENISRKDDFNAVKISTDWRRNMYLTLETKQRKVRAVLDSGAPNYIFLNESLETDFDKNQLLQRKAQYISASNSSILDTLSIYKTHSLKLGETELDKSLIVFLNIQNLVGNEFLRSFEEVIINAKQKKLYLSKNQIPESTTSKLTKINIGYNNQAVRIIGLSLDYKSEKNDLRIGDHIININGSSTLDIKDACSYSAFESILNLYSDRISLIVLRDGKELKCEIDKSTMYE